jgi:hypothetical protein
MDTQDIDDYQYVMEDMTMLPDITILHLNILANKHAFGASAFHALRMCSGIRKLMLEFLAPTVVEVRPSSFIQYAFVFLAFLAYHGLISAPRHLFLYCLKVMAHILVMHMYLCIHIAVWLLITP